MPDHGAVTAWNGVAVAVADDVALLRPRAARIAADAIDAAGRLDGYRWPPEVTHVRNVLRFVATYGGSGQPDVRNLRTPAPSQHESGADDWITTAEAAELIGCTQRHASRLAQQGRLGRTRMSRKKRLVTRVEVLEHVIDRSTP